MSSIARATIRVSHGSQIEGHSLDAQRREITAWCVSRGYEPDIRAEEGVSAKTDRLTKRPEILKVMADAREKMFDVYVVHTLDRLARNQRVQQEVLATLGNYGIGFATVVEGHDYTSPHSKLILSVMGAVNEFYSDQLGVHVSKAQRQRVAEGLPVGPVPFGYRSPTPGACPLPVPEEAAALLECWRRRATGESMGVLAEILNNQGFATREGKRFTAHALKDILYNPFYTGVVSYKGETYAGKHEPIIPRHLFDKVLDRKGSHKAPRRTWGEIGVLQGVLYCGMCGNPIQSDRGYQGRPMYRERHAAHCLTNGRSTMAAAIDHQIADIICSLELDPAWMSRLTELATLPEAGPSITQLQEKLRRLGVAYLDTLVSEREYRARKAEIDTQMQRAMTRVTPSHEEAAALLGNIPELWKEATSQERQKLISPLVERVYVSLESKQVGAIVPTPAFRSLLQCARQRSRSELILVAPDELERLEDWSWWRRGRIELPVQKKHVQNLLQAYPGI